MPRGIYDRSKVKHKGPGRPKGSKNKSVWAQVPEGVITKPTNKAFTGKDSPMYKVLFNCVTPDQLTQVLALGIICTVHKIQ